MITAIGSATEHPLNRNLFIADNLSLLRRLDNDSIDLICIDPPFAKNQTFIGNLRPPLSAEEQAGELAMLSAWGISSERDAEAAGIFWANGADSARFRDIWRWESDIHEEWITAIDADRTGLAKVIDATRNAHSEQQAAYLSYMAIRLIEIRRILKPTGSLYFHCDFDANSYIRLALDAVFGRQNVRNEIIWERHTSTQRGSQHRPRRWGRTTDTILFCSKSQNANFTPFVPPSDAEAAQRFPLVDENGERYYDDSAHIWRTPGMGSRPNLCYEWRGFTNPTPAGWRLSQERLEEEYQKGNFVILPDGRLQRRMYQRDWRGAVRGNLWNDVSPALGGERTGYPTQKPVALAERIILASTRPGDVVLDCFAGCAYVPVAAERNGRQWIACDISPRALTVLKRQFAKFRYAVDGVQQGQAPALITDANVITRSPFDLPERTDTDPVERRDIAELPERTYKVPASIIPEREMLEFLLELSGYTAWCCGFANRRPDGSVIRTTRNFHLDHLDPKSLQGSNQIYNRAPMCPHHNIRKNNRRVHLEEYRKEIADAGEMMVNSIDELVHWPSASDQAHLRWAQAVRERGTG